MSMCVNYKLWSCIKRCTIPQCLCAEREDVAGIQLSCYCLPHPPPHQYLRAAVSALFCNGSCSICLVHKSESVLCTVTQWCSSVWLELILLVSLSLPLNQNLQYTDIIHLLVNSCIGLFSSQCKLELSFLARSCSSLCTLILLLVLCSFLHIKLWAKCLSLLSEIRSVEQPQQSCSVLHRPATFFGLPIHSGCGQIQRSKQQAASFHYYQTTQPGMSSKCRRDGFGCWALSCLISVFWNYLGHSSGQLSMTETKETILVWLNVYKVWGV